MATVKTCQTCEHEEVSIDVHPCARCVRADSYDQYWEPKEGLWDGGGARPGIPELPAPVSDPLAAILADRAKTHGDYSVHAGCTQQLKAVAQEWLPEGEKDKLSMCQQESLDMIFHKIGRIIAGDPSVEDHWRDIAGYATLVADRCKAP